MDIKLEDKSDKSRFVFINTHLMMRIDFNPPVIKRCWGIIVLAGIVAIKVAFRYIGGLRALRVCV